jgi:hypothetical protein
VRNEGEFVPTKPGKKNPFFPDAMMGVSSLLQASFSIKSLGHKSENPPILPSSSTQSEPFFVNSSVAVLQ